MTRRLWSGCVLLALLLLTGAARAEQFGVTAADPTAMRQEPSTAAAAVFYPQGTWMALGGESGGWYAATAPDGVTGYISAGQLQRPQIIRAQVGVVSNLSESGYVNLRQAPNYQATVLAAWHNGVPCLLLSHSGGWYHVRGGGLDGYLREEYVQPMQTAWAEEAATVVVAGSGAAELRTGPGAAYPALSAWPGGQYVILLQQGLDWWYVSVGGQTGFMDARYLREGILSLTEIASVAWTSLNTAWAVVDNPGSNQLLNLRQSPSTMATVIGQYRNGTRLMLLGQGLEWCRVMNDEGETGYMMTQYLRLEGVPAVPVMTVTHPDGTYVNLRSAPSIYLGAVLLQVPHGAQVEVLTPGTEWVQVRYGDETGYMAAAFLTE